MHERGWYSVFSMEFIGDRSSLEYEILWSATLVAALEYIYKYTALYWSVLHIGDRVVVMIPSPSARLLATVFFFWLLVVF